MTRHLLKEFIRTVMHEAAVSTTAAHQKFIQEQCAENNVAPAFEKNLPALEIGFFDKSMEIYK